MEHSRWFFGGTNEFEHVEELYVFLLIEKFSNLRKKRIFNRYYNAENVLYKNDLLEK